MKKFCPNCGAKVDANEKFCSNCGKDLSKVKDVPKPKSNLQPVKTMRRRSAPKKIKRKNISHQNRVSKRQNPRKKTIATISTIVVIVLAVVGGLFTFNAYQKDQAAASAIDHMSNKKLAGLTLAYAHFHYPKNRAWNEAYNDALDNGVTVF